MNAGFFRLINRCTKQSGIAIGEILLALWKACSVSQMEFKYGLFNKAEVATILSESQGRWKSGTVENFNSECIVSAHESMSVSSPQS